jgi:DNA polymerase-3 subunit beta
MELVVRKTDLLRELQLFQGIVERLYEIIKALPETDVRIEQDRNGVKVAADRFDSRMQTLPREDFPSLPEATGSYSASLPREVLKQMVAKTQFAITGEDTRYFLNGALFILRADSMGLVSTDGHRLALVNVPREKGKNKVRAEEEVRVILPRKTLLELGRLLSEGEGDILYERGENHLFFDIGGRLLISRMIDGQFPAFERVIPKSNDKRVEFDRDRLTSAVKRVALLSNERSRAVKFQIDKGKVEIASSSPEFGEAKEVLIVDYASAPVTICFNAQYVLDFLGVVETDSVSLEFKDEMSQAVMKPIGADGYEYTYVIMPMRV